MRRWKFRPWNLRGEITPEISGVILDAVAAHREEDRLRHLALVREFNEIRNALSRMSQEAR